MARGTHWFLCDSWVERGGVQFTYPGLGYLLGHSLGLATDLDTVFLSGMRIKVSPSGKPGLKVKTTIRF